MYNNCLQSGIYMIPISYTFSNLTSAGFIGTDEQMRDRFFAAIKGHDLESQGQIGIVKILDNDISPDGTATKLAAMTFRTEEGIKTVLIRDRGRLSEKEIEVSPITKYCWEITDNKIPELQQGRMWKTLTKSDAIYKDLILLQGSGQTTPFMSIFPNDFQLPLGKIQKYLLWKKTEEDKNFVIGKLIQIRKRFDPKVKEGLTLGVIQEIQGSPFLYRLTCYGRNPFTRSTIPVSLHLYLDTRDLTVMPYNEGHAPLHVIANKDFYFLLPSGNEIARSTEICSEEHSFKAISTPPLNFSESVQQDFLFTKSLDERLDYIESEIFQKIQKLNAHSSQKITRLIAIHATSLFPKKYELIVLQNDSWTSRTCPEDPRSSVLSYFPFDLTSKTVQLKNSQKVPLDEFLAEKDKSTVVLKNDDELVSISEFLQPHDPARAMRKTLGEINPQLEDPIIQHMILDYMGDHGDNSSKLPRVTCETDL